MALGRRSLGLLELLQHSHIKFSGQTWVSQGFLLVLLQNICMRLTELMGTQTLDADASGPRLALDVRQLLSRGPDFQRSLGS